MLGFISELDRGLQQNWSEYIKQLIVTRQSINCKLQHETYHLSFSYSDLGFKTNQPYSLYDIDFNLHKIFEYQYFL